MKTPLTPADIDWLGRNIPQYCSGAAKLSRNAEARIAQILNRESPHAGEQISDVARLALDHLAAETKVGQFQWSTAVNPHSIPSLIRLPGVGWGIVYAKGDSGRWLIDLPDGVLKTGLFPRGTQFAPLHSLAVQEEGGESALSLFRRAILSRKSLFLQAASASLLANFLVLGASLYSMQVYDRVIPTQSTATRWVLTVGVLLSVLMELVVKIARSRIMDEAISGIDLQLSKKIFERLLGIRMDQLPASVGTLSGQLRGYETIRSFASSAVLYIAVDAPFALLFLIAIALLGGMKIAAVPTIFFLVAVGVGLYYRRKIELHAKSGNAASNRKLGLLVETVENAELVKSTGSGWQHQARWDALNRQSVEDDYSIRSCSEHASYFAGFMQQASYVGLVAAGAWVASTSTDLTMGALIACSILSGRVLAPLGALPGLIVQWAHAQAALKGLEAVFSLHRDNEGISTPLVPSRINGDFHLVDLRYAYRDQPVTLSIPGLSIRAGEKVGLLGAIGSGKSTLLKIMAGLYSPTEGRVLLDGLEIQQISRAHLSERIAYCPQDSRLFAGTLRDNLIVGLAGIDDESILEACRKTGLAQLIAAHPKGLDLPIAEGGSGISGGQRQLVAITRLLLSHPDVWLLDEPTASMDEQTEARSLGALRRAITAESTMVLVTHKPALIALVDRLVILVGGRILMDGPRDMVLAHLRKMAIEQSDEKTKAGPTPIRVVIPGGAK